MLLPEIALSVEFLDRVEARFGARPAEWHSGVTQAARRRAWFAVASGDARLVVGARSALFLPFADLGLVVVDEEHDGSYKQEDGACYHARDMAVLRASIEQAAVVLASATPSLESWANAEAGKYARLDLPERFGVATLPEMRAIDLPRGRAGGRAVDHRAPLVAAVNARLAAGEQSLLFLNRRGYAPLTICRACGHQVGCDACDARMVEHRFRKRLVCHQCGATKPIPNECPACKVEGRMTALGPGVERLAEEAVALWPEARIAILSSDLAEGPRALKARIEEIAGGGADIVIGTQIVSKGHNFPLLTLVGVIDADLGLQGGDLRAAEKTFQLIRQVAGRAGRAERPGLALVQTHQPEHPALRAILTGRRRGLLAGRGRGAAAGGDAALRAARGGGGERDRRAADVGGRPGAGAGAGAARGGGRGALRAGAGADRAGAGAASGAAAGAGGEGGGVAAGAAGVGGGGAVSGERAGGGGRRSAELLLKPGQRPARAPPAHPRAPGAALRAKGRWRSGRSGRGRGLALQSRLGPQGERSMTGKPTDDLERRIAQARGDEPADLVLRGGRVFDLVTGSMIDGRRGDLRRADRRDRGGLRRGGGRSTSRGWCWCRGSSTRICTSRAASSRPTSSTAA